MITVVDHVSPWLTPSRSVREEHPFPGRRPHQQKWHGHRDQPPRDEHALAPEPIGQAARAVVRERLRDAEYDDERQHGGASRELEFPLGNRGQDAALQPRHRADEGVDDDEERELCEVFAETQTNLAARTSRRRAHSRLPVRRASPDSMPQPRARHSATPCSRRSARMPFRRRRSTASSAITQ